MLSGAGSGSQVPDYWPKAFSAAFPPLFNASVSPLNFPGQHPLVIL